MAVNTLAVNAVELTGRPYQRERDLAAITRMWREAGWIDGSEARASVLADVLAGGSAVVADIGGSAECLVHRAPGSLRYGVGPTTTDLDLSTITFVVTGHVARHQGLAGGLVARSLAEAAEDGAAVATLGVFDQGYYDRFGFGTGADEHIVSFAPATLNVPIPDRRPVRISVDDHREVYELLMRRHRGHGSVVLDLSACIEACVPPGANLTFGLRLHDPLAERSGATWSGIGGDYTVHLGDECDVADGLPGGPPELIAALDLAFRLPPLPDWPY